VIQKTWKKRTGGKAVNVFGCQGNT